ncbi:MAG TPA: phospholipid carrier-dependent glycosyltransferase [Gemmatimonadales bacterium]
MGPRLAALGLVLAGLTANIAAYPLLDPDEGRNAEVAREMAATGEFALPHLNGLPYVDKPALHFAVTALAVKTFGATEFAARLPSLLFTLGTLGVVGWFGRRLLGSAGGWAAVIATGAAPLTLGFARTVIFDATLTFFVVVALAAFYLATDRRDGGAGSLVASPGPSVRRSAWGEGAGWGWTAVAWAAIGLGVLTKGPIALALPLMVAAPYAAWRRASAAVWTPVGPLLCAAIVLPWVLAVSRHIPDLVRYTLVTETAERLFTERLQRTEPIWYFLPILLAGALPGSALVVAGWRAAGPLRLPDGTRDPRTVFLLLWILIPLAFFSLSHSKRPQYMLPIVPAVALLAARGWRPTYLPGAREAGMLLMALGGVVGLAPVIVPRLLDVSEGTRAAMPQAAAFIGAATAMGGALLWLSRRRGELALVALALPAATIPLASRALMREIGRERSAAALAEGIRAAVPPGGRVVAIQTFPLSLPFYLNQPVLLATDSGRELTSNYLSRRMHRWRAAPGTPLRPANWWREALQECRASVFVTRADDRPTRLILQTRLPLLIETSRHAAYGPCGRSPLAAGR